MWLGVVPQVAPNWLSYALLRFETEVQPRFELVRYDSFLRIPLNNATLLSRRLYYHRLELFEALYARLGGDLRRTIDLTLASVRERPDDPYAAVERLLRALEPDSAVVLTPDATTR